MDPPINVDPQEAAMIYGGLWTLSGGKDIQDCIDNQSRKPFMKGNKKGIGYRWNDGTGNVVRIDQGNPDNSQVFQQVDHVVINSGGKIIGSIKDHAEEAHIPLEEWLRWKEWDKP